ncbi:hypothetical protein MRX96_036596 [Rhipicephalus microplus]
MEPKMCSPTPVRLFIWAPNFELFEGDRGYAQLWQLERGCLDISHFRTCDKFQLYRPVQLLHTLNCSGAMRFDEMRRIFVECRYMALFISIQLPMQALKNVPSSSIQPSRRPLEKTIDVFAATVEELSGNEPDDLRGGKEGTGRCTDSDVTERVGDRMHAEVDEGSVGYAHIDRHDSKKVAAEFLDVEIAAFDEEGAEEDT